MLKNRIKNSKLIPSMLCCIALQGCADSINERNRLEAERWANIWEEKPVVVENENSAPPARPVIPEVNEEVNTAADEDLLREQEDRIKRIETSIEALLENQKDLKEEIANIKENTEEMDVALNDNSVDANMVKQDIPSVNAKGIHLASYRTMDNLKIGWQEYLNSGHQIIQNKQARIMQANVSGIEYLRLVVGPYENLAEATNACTSMKQTVSFCEVIDFNGEILQ